MKAILLIASLFLFTTGSQLHASETTETEVDWERLESIYESYDEHYENDPEAFQLYMIANPIDYTLINDKLAQIGVAVAQESPVIKSANLSFRSVLTSQWHKWLTLNGKYPNLPYWIPHNETKAAIEVVLEPNAELPIPIRGFSLALEADQTVLSPRGVLHLGGTIGTDTYTASARVDLDSLAVLKKIFGTPSLQEFCASPETWTEDLPEDISDAEELQTIAENACFVADTVETAASFPLLIATIEEPIDAIDRSAKKLIKKYSKTYLSGIAGGILGTVGEFVTRAAYSFDIEAKSCERIEKLWASVPLTGSCGPKLTLEGGGGAVIGDIDGSVEIDETSVLLKLHADVSADLRTDFIGSKKEVAAMLYMAAKTFENIRESEIQAIAVEAAEGLTDIAEGFEEEFNDEGALEFFLD